MQRHVARRSIFTSIRAEPFGCQGEVRKIWVLETSGSGDMAALRVEYNRAAVCLNGRYHSFCSEFAGAPARLVRSNKSLPS